MRCKSREEGRMVIYEIKEGKRKKLPRFLFLFPPDGQPFSGGPCGIFQTEAKKQRHLEMHL